MSSMKYISLVLLFVQNGMTPIFFRFAMTGAGSEDRFRTSTAVLLQEMVKLFMSLGLLFAEGSYSAPRLVKTIRDEIFNKPIDTLKLGVPALLYFVQNNILQLASSNLPAALFQVTYQGKTLIVALCSIVLLGKVLTRVQWGSLLVLATGLTIVQLSKATEAKQEGMANAGEQSIAIGLILVLIGCFCSGFAGVYFEKMMKTPQTNEPTKKPSMWLRNTQLSAFSIALGIVPLLLFGDGEKPYLHGFTTNVWLMVLNNAVGGLLVAMVIKHADNILKGFACALATVLTCILAVPFFGFEVNFSFLLGMAGVLVATLLYGKTLKVESEWWNSEPSMCANLRQSGDASYQKLTPEATTHNGEVEVTLPLPDLDPSKDFDDLEMNIVGDETEEQALADLKRELGLLPSLDSSSPAQSSGLSDNHGSLPEK